LGPINVNKKLI